MCLLAGGCVCVCVSVVCVKEGSVMQRCLPTLTLAINIVQRAHPMCRATGHIALLSDVVSWRQFHSCTEHPKNELSLKRSPTLLLKTNKSQP